MVHHIDQEEHPHISNNLDYHPCQVPRLVPNSQVVEGTVPEEDDAHDLDAGVELRFVLIGA